jgi:hypothetical protein
VSAKNIGEYSTEILRRLGFRPDVFAELEDHWRRMMDERLVAHVRPARYRQGRLSVLADTPAWAGRIRQQQQSLIGRLRQDPFFKNLRELKISVAPRAQASDIVATTPTHRSRVPADAARLLGRAAETITDPELSAALRRLGDAPRPGNSKRS